MRLILLVAMIATGANAQPYTDDLDLQRTPLTVPEQYASLYAGIDSVWLPDGFSIEVFAAGFQQPRFMAWSPDRVLHVADFEGRRIVAMPDRDGDGAADTLITAADGLDSTHSLAFYSGALYAAQASKVLRLRDLDRDGFYESRETFIDRIHSEGVYNHYTRTILFDTVGGYIYLGVGASCNACREEFPERASILRFDLNGSYREVFANGLRNPIGLAINPVDRSLWATNADRDWLGETIPRELIARVARGSFHGWPFAYGDRTYINFHSGPPEYLALLPITAADSSRVNAMHVPEVTIAAHSTPIGIAFTPLQKYPSSWRGSAVVAVHGSAPNSRPSGAVGYNVVRIRSNENGDWTVGEFLTGFLTDTVGYEYWGRPCGVTFDTAGAIYLSSDRGIPAIYKITYHPPEVSVPVARTSAAVRMRALPNPSRNGVTFAFELARASSVAIRVFDYLGRAVGAVDAGMQISGAHRVALQQALPAGMYRAEIVADGIVQENCGFAVE